MSEQPTARVGRVGARREGLARGKPPRATIGVPPRARRKAKRSGRRQPSARIVGEVVVRGRTRRVTAPAPRRSLLRRRYAVVYDIAGPRIRLGLLWFAAVVAGLALGPGLLVPLYAATAALAAYQTAGAWRSAGSPADPRVAAVGAALVTGAAAFGAPLAGLAVLCVVLAATTACIVDGRRRVTAIIESAGITVQSAVFAGLAGAGVVLTLRLEIGAAVVLLVLVAMYEVGDYIVGSGASSSLEGPAAGAVAVAVASFVIAVLRVPPFDGADAFVFGGFAAVGCPLGQLFASALLPAADAPAPALRRLDSLLVLAPAWCLLVGVYIERAVG